MHPGAPEVVGNRLGSLHAADGRARPRRATDRVHTDRVPLDLRGDGAEENETNLPVVRARRDYQCGTLARLFMTRLGIKLKPDGLSTLWDILRSHLPGLSAYRCTGGDLFVYVPRSDLPE
jgi:hypothetical protein